MLAEHELEDVSFSEQSLLYPIEEKQKCLQQTHFLAFVRAGANTGGFPVRRKRTLGAQVSRGTLVWTGPQTPHGIQLDFDAKFKKAVTVDGSFFMKAGPHEVEGWVRRRARRRKAMLPTGFAQEPQENYLHLLVSPSCMAIKDEYANKRMDSQLMGEAFFCDLDHHLGHGPTPGKMFPTALTHNSLLLPTRRWAWSFGNHR